MRRILILMLGITILSGCANRMTLEELESEAERTGDWSAVENRREALARFNARFPSNDGCGLGEVRECESIGGTEENTRCRCKISGSGTINSDGPVRP